MVRKTEESPALVAAALEYAAEGLAVFPVWGIRAPAPREIVAQWHAGKLDKKEALAHAVCACGNAGCPSPGKHPVGKLVPNGANDATLDAAVIERWFSQPGLNVGIVMPPGFVALDFDTYSKDVQARLDKLRIQRVATLEQQSGAGGRHLIFSGVPEGFQFGSHLDGVAGVDLIHAGNRYLVAAPSGHWSGGSYSWANDGAPAPIPAHLLARVARGVRPARVASSTPRVTGRSASEDRDLMCPLEVTDPLDWAITLAAERLEPAIANDEPGSYEPGHVTLTRAACHLIAGCNLDEDAALEVLWEEYNPRCVPPWEEHERADFERTVRGAGADAEPGYLIPSEATRVLAADAEARVAKRRERGLEPKRVTLPEPASPEGVAGSGLGRLHTFAEPDEPLEYLCEGLCLAPSTGKISLVAGEPGGGKGPIANHLAVCFALGVRAFGAFACQQVNVLLLDNEGARLTMRRLRRLARGLNRDPAELDGRLHVFDSSGESLLTDAYHEKLEAFVAAHAIRVIVLDSYTSAMLGAGVDANQPEFAVLAKVLGALGVLVLAVSHTNKEAAARGGQPRISDIAYSGAFGAMAQTAIVVHYPEPNDRNRIHVGCARGPEGEFPGFDVRFGGGKDDPLTVRQVLTSGAEEPGAAKARAHRETVAKRADRIEQALGPDEGSSIAHKLSDVRSAAGLSGDSWGEALAECLNMRRSVVREGGRLRYVPPAQRQPAGAEHTVFAPRARPGRFARGPKSR